MRQSDLHSRGPDEHWVIWDSSAAIQVFREWRCVYSRFLKGESVFCLTKVVQLRSVCTPSCVVILCHVGALHHNFLWPDDFMQQGCWNGPKQAGWSKYVQIKRGMYWMQGGVNGGGSQARERTCKGSVAFKDAGIISCSCAAFFNYMSFLCSAGQKLKCGRRFQLRKGGHIRTRWILHQSHGYVCAVSTSKLDELFKMSRPNSLI